MRLNARAHLPAINRTQRNRLSRVKKANREARDRALWVELGALWNR